MATKKTATPAEKAPEKETELTLEAQEEEFRDRLQQKQNEISKKDAQIEQLKAQLAAAQKPAPAAAMSQESDYDRIHRIEKETAEAGTDAWTVEVEVLVPHREKTEDPWYWICVNNQSVQIPANDRYQRMKLPFACVLVDQLAYEKHSADYQDSLEVYDPETNPHRG